MTNAIEVTGAATAVLANFRVPREPRPRDFSSGQRASAWGAWLKSFRCFVEYRRVRPVLRRCRVQVTIRRCEGPRWNPVTDETLEGWRSGVRSALLRTGLVPESLLGDVEVQYRFVAGCGAAARVAIEGTQIEIFEADAEEDQCRDS